MTTTTQTSGQPCDTCGDTGWCVHRKATYYGPPEDFTIAGRQTMTTTTQTTYYGPPEDFTIAGGRR